MDKRSLWNLKNEEICELCVKYGIEIDPENFDRKTTIEALNIAQAKAGDLTEARIMKEDGDLEPLVVRPKQKYVDVRFHDKEGQPKTLFFGDNGTFYWLPTKRTCRIPISLYEVLKQAVATMTVLRVIDGKNKYVDEDVPRFSYEVVGFGEK